MNFILAIFAIFLESTYANEKSSAFLVTIFDNYVKVVSPDKQLKETSVIIENKTLTKVYGKIEKENSVLFHLAILPSELKSYPLKDIGSSSVSFVPLAPAFQEVQLMFGKKSYEVPPQK